MGNQILLAKYNEAKNWLAKNPPNYIAQWAAETDIFGPATVEALYEAGAPEVIFMSTTDELVDPNNQATDDNITEATADQFTPDQLIVKYPNCEVGMKCAKILTDCGAEIEIDEDAKKITAEYSK